MSDFSGFGSGSRSESTKMQREQIIQGEHHAVIAEVSLSENQFYKKSPLRGFGEKQLQIVIAVDQLQEGGDFKGENHQLRKWFHIFTENADGSRWVTFGPETAGSFENAPVKNIFGTPANPLDFVSFVEAVGGKKIPIGQGVYEPIYLASNFDPGKLEGKKLNILLAEYKPTKNDPSKSYPIFGVKKSEPIGNVENTMVIPDNYVRVADRKSSASSSVSTATKETQQPDDDDIPF